MTLIEDSHGIYYCLAVGGVWEALWNGLFIPMVQILDSHAGTIGYGLWNEPGTGQDWSLRLFTTTTRYHV